MKQMKRMSSVLVVTMVVVFWSAPAVRAGSIWGRGSRRTQVLHADDTARSVGDSLTIVIEESSKQTTDTSRKKGKKSPRKGAMSGTVDLANLVGEVGRHIFDLPNIDASSSAETKFEGSADYESNRKVTDRMTVTVQDVMANGNLVVQGTRIRAVEGDRQIVQMSGIVRPSDVTFANTISSKQVADFRVVYKVKGPETSFTKPGWMARVLNLLNPF